MHSTGNRLILPKNSTASNQTAVAVGSAKKRAYNCADCGLSLTRYDNLLQHEAAHVLEQQKLQAHICHKCCTLFENALQLQLHAANCLQFSCKRCQKTYASKRFLLRHLQHVHKQNTLLYNCSICRPTEDTKFYVCSNLLTHYVDSHKKAEEDFFMNEEFLEEILLGDVGDNSLGLTEWEHLDLDMDMDMLLTAPTTAGLKCPECFVESMNVAEFFKHLKSSHAGLYLQYKSNPQCPYCGRKFDKRTYLRQHMRRLHAVSKTHVCQICDKAFATEDYLRKHVLSVHNNCRRYACTLCDKRFLQNPHLEKHLRRHTQGNQYACTFCQLIYIRQIDLIRHVRKEHDMNVKCQ